MITRKIKFLEFIEKAKEKNQKYLGVLHESEDGDVTCMIYKNDFKNAISLYNNEYDNDMRSYDKKIKTTRAAYANSFDELEMKLFLKVEGR